MPGHVALMQLRLPFHGCDARSQRAGGGCLWRQRRRGRRTAQGHHPARAEGHAPWAAEQQIQHHCHPQQVVRVLAATDLHVDYAENMGWCRRLDGRAYRRDVLAVSGDVSDDLGAVEEALGCLAGKFGAVFYTPGNHELWVRERDRSAGVLDSQAKLHRVLELCASLGVHTAPRRLGNLWLAPLLSWHHKSFDCEPDIPGVPPVSSWTIADYSACRWPASVPGGHEPGSLQLAQWFDGLNDAAPGWRQLLAERGRCDVVALAHFLPHQALLPEKRYLYFPGLAKAVGSVPLRRRLATLAPDLCLVGHTHFAWDAAVQGVRYVQAPLCSPTERRRRTATVGFGGGLAAVAAQQGADPVAASWLPVEVYRGWAPEGWEARGMDRLEGVSSSQSPATALGAVGGDAVAGVSPPQQQQQQQQQQDGAAVRQAAGEAPHFLAAASAGSAGSPLSPAQKEQLQAWVAQGWQPLRHGAMAPPLRAHWSDYYVHSPRRPDDLAMAPWVARVYEKRRARAARSGGFSSGGETDGG